MRVTKVFVVVLGKPGFCFISFSNIHIAERGRESYVYTPYFIGRQRRAEGEKEHPEKQHCQDDFSRSTAVTYVEGRRRRLDVYRERGEGTG